MKLLYLIAAMIIGTNCSAQPHTEFSKETREYGQLLKQLENMMLHSEFLKTEHLGGKDRHVLVPWLRDNTHVTKAMKYFYPDVQSFASWYLETQAPSGLFYDYYYPLSFGGTGAGDRKKIFPQKYWRVFMDDSIQMHRLPVEADLEYLMVEAVYAIWQSTGDTGFIKKWLPAMVKGMNYAMTDPVRWSKKYQLVKRGYTLDTWDFMQLPTSREEYQKKGGNIQKGIFYVDENTPMGIMHGDNSGMFAACNQLSQMFKVAGDANAASDWQKKAQHFREATNALCWNGKYYAHFIEDDPMPPYLKMDQQHTLSLSNPYDINRGLPTEEMAESIIDTYKALKESNKDSSFAEWYGVYPPVSPSFADYTPGSYMNGGVNTIVAGELAKAAFEHGEEKYGLDILHRLMDLVKIHHDSLPVSYTPRGVPDPGIPDNWGQAALYSALIEGLAGVVDKGSQFSDLEIAPRWLAAGIDTATITVAYGPTHKNVTYHYLHDVPGKKINFSMNSPAENVVLKLLLPANAGHIVVTADNKQLHFQTETLRDSRYAVIKGLHGNTNVVVEYGGQQKPIKPVARLQSPDKNIDVSISVSDKVGYSVAYKSNAVTEINNISLVLDNGKSLGTNERVKKITSNSVDKEVHPLYGMAEVYHDRYNETTLQFRDYSIVFRAYNNGVAYRFVTHFPGKIKVRNEEVNYSFNSDVDASMMQAKNDLYSYEEHYTDDRISALDSGRRAALPLLVQAAPVKVVLTESDLLDYPGLYFTYDGNNGLKGIFPEVVTKDSIGGCCPNFEKLPLQRAGYIAATDGTRSFPWRLMVIAEKDKDLLYNDLVYLLASDNRIGDASWVKPGKVAWDWWSANNLTGVNFKTGFNTETYKYFIDFAAANGIEYINMDEGWSDQFDLLKLNNGDIRIGSNAGGGLDMPWLFNYAREKGVGIILWCVWHTLDRQMDSALDQFQKWGVKGLKVDFMDRDDQTVINFYERLAGEAAKRKMFVNFHGACKPTGLERTYPNIVNREAVQGLEYNKFSDKCTPEHAAHIPFIRMVAGSMDYTPGGLYNASQKDFRVVSERPMTQGTRCQQLAMFTLFYAPLEMLSDAPTAYEKEPDILHYFAQMPTTWDETVPLDGKAGDYAVIARRKGSSWFVSGITDWSPREVNVDLDFLTAKKYRAEIFTDGVNAGRNGNDYRRQIRSLVPRDTLNIHLAPGGGFAIKLTSEDISGDSTKLVSLLQGLASKEKNPLLKRHFNSVLTILQDTTHSAENFKRDFEDLSGTLDFFKTEGSRWETYRDGPRPLIMAFNSPTDHKNSYYWLFLPKSFDPSNKNYPFYLELHGSGGGVNDDPRRMLLQPLRTKLEGVTSQGFRKEGLFILPWGRGDKSYAGIAETDIFECLKDFDSMFVTDKTRQYLFGFSMGGAGTFHLAQKSLPRWTALGMYSAAFKSVSQEEANTIKNIPVWMAWGETEPWAVNDRLLKDYLLKAGATVQWQEVKGIGHNYLGEYQEKLMDWFLQHRTGHF